MILTLEKLGFGYHKVPLFSDVSFTLQKGQVVRLMGPNGTGKSTMMKIIAGLFPPDKGRCLFFEDDQTEIDDRRTVLEYLGAENNGLFNKMGALENLQYWVKFRQGDNRKEALFGVLERWGLNHPMFREKFPVEQFSTGMKRRLALARVTASTAPCWLLDEPLFGLDQSAVATLRQAIGEHTAKGGSVVIVSHEPSIFDGTDHQVIEIKRRGSDV